MQKVSAWWRGVHQEGTPWLLLGKGPSFHQRQHHDLTRFHTIAINHVIREIRADVASAVDIDVVVACAQAIDTNARFLLMPAYPYDFGGRQSCPLEAYFDAIPILRKLDAEGRLIRYNLGDTPRDPGEIQVPGGAFSAEILVNLLAALGVRQIRTLGVDGGKRYDAAFRDIEAITCLRNGQDSFDVQFEGIALAIRRYHLDYAALALPDADTTRILQRAYVRGFLRRLFPARLREWTRPYRKRMRRLLLRQWRRGGHFTLHLR